MTELIVKSSNKAEHQATRAILQEALDRQKKMLKTAFLRTRENLNHFESRYHMDSATFFKRYQNGEIDDQNDFVDWAGEYQILENLQNQSNFIEEIILCK